MKKTLAIVLALALLCTLAVGTTLTYFTDDDFDKNTMTVGNVKIEQEEEFNTNTALRPYIGDPVQTGFATAKNAVTKIVTVKKTGTEAAYIRTLVAFEAVNGNDPVDPAAPIIHIDRSGDDVGAWAPMGTVTVEGVLYYVYSFTYNGSFAGDVTTAPSLKAIALDCNQGNEFYDAIGADGQYNILVVSQAVQSTGFADAAEAFTAAFPLAENNAIPENWFTQPQSQG